MVTLGRLSLERLSQVDPPVGAATSEAAEIRSSAAIENFVMDILLGRLRQLYTGAWQFSVGVLFRDAGMLF